MLVSFILWMMCIFLIWLILKPNNSLTKPPVYPGGLPFIGHGLLLLGDSLGLWEFVKKVSHYSLEAGGIASISVLWKQFYFITDYDDFLKVMNTCLDKSFLYEYAKDWVGNGLVTADLESWKKSRKLFNPAFTQRALCRFLDVFNSQSRRLVDKLAVEAGKGSFDHHPIVVNNSLQTVNRTTLGIKTEDCYSMYDEEYIHDTDTLFDLFLERLQKFWLGIPFLYNRSELKIRIDAIVNKVKAISYTVLNKYKLEFKDKVRAYDQEFTVLDKNTTVMDIVMESFMNDNFTDKDMREHLETFIFGSFHTTGTQLVFTLKAIGSHPEVQERIVKELEQVFGDEKRDVERADLSKLVYLEAVLKETIRLYPVVPVVARDANVDVQLKTFVVPRGTTCVGSIYGLNHHPMWGAESDKFRPDRWLDPKRPPDSMFAGFSLGRRNCIGTQFAMTVLKISIVHILRRYRVFADTNEPIAKWNAYLQPSSGHHISLELRS